MNCKLIMVAQPIMNFILRHLGTKKIVHSK